MKKISFAPKLSRSMRRILTARIFRIFRLLAFHSGTIHLDRRVPLTLFGAILIGPWAVGKLLWKNRKKEHTVVIVNQSGLGHSIFETISALKSSKLGDLNRPLKIFYLSGCRRSPNLPTLFAGWKRLAESEPKRPSLEGLDCSSWVALSAFARVASGKVSWLEVTTPDYRGYNGISKDVAKELFHVHIPQVHSKTLDRILESGHGFCLLGTRESITKRSLDHRRSSPGGLYLPAMNFLLEEGIPVIRGGRNQKSRLNIDSPLFFDYATSDFVSEKLDLMLMSNASMGIGDSFGLMDAVALFGAPTLMATYPLLPEAFISHPLIYFATQRVKNVATGRDVPLSELVAFFCQGGSFTGNRANGHPLWLMEMPSAKDVLEATRWFLSLQESPEEPTWDSSSPSWLVETLTPLSTTKVYFSNPTAWGDYESHIWPESVARIRDQDDGAKVFSGILG